MSQGFLFGDSMKDTDTEHGEKFKFNKDVTACFSDMLSRSIPSYDLMRDLTTNIIVEYLTANGRFLDVGCSDGQVIENVLEYFKHAYYTGLEISDPMIEAAKERFEECGTVSIRKHDLRKRFNSFEPYDVILSCLTIQFTPMEYRLQILKNIYDLLHKDGVFIFVEKVLGNTAEIDAHFVKQYYKIKEENGYSFEEIQRKKMALEGVLVPVTAKWNEEMLYSSGFRKVDCFWRCLNFAGWIALK